MREVVLCAADSTIQADDIQAVLMKRVPAAGPAAAASAASFAGGRSLKDIADSAAADAERRAISEALQNTSGNKTQAARLLQVDYKTLYNKLKRYGLATP
jgi:two-component system nitrogen regulation response regulator GlnG